MRFQNSPPLAPTELPSPPQGGTVRVRDLTKAAQELAAVWLDVDETDIEVEVTVEVPENITHMWREGAEAEAQGRATIDRGSALRRKAIRELREQGYTDEAAAQALGVSRQRVQQLAKSQKQKVAL